MDERTSTRHRLRFTLRQLLIAVAIAALACCWFVWPREREYWEPLGSAAQDNDSQFHIQFEIRGLDVVAVPGRRTRQGDLTEGKSAKDESAEWRIFWFDQDTVRHAELVDDRPVRIHGEWPLKVFVVTHRRDEEDSIEAVSVCSDGTIERPFVISGAKFDENDDRFDTPEELYHFFSERL